MMDMMADMDKKGSGKMSDQDVKAKSDVLEELLEMAHGMMANKAKKGLDGMKVGVEAKDPKSLELGLEKAKEMVGHMRADGDASEMMDDHDGDMGDHDSNSLDEEAARDGMMDIADEAEKSDSEDQKPSIMDDEDEDEGLFSKRRKEMALKKMMK